MKRLEDVLELAAIVVVLLFAAVCLFLRLSYEALRVET